MEILPRGNDDLAAKIDLLDIFNCSARDNHLYSLDWQQQRQATSTWVQKIADPWLIQTHRDSTRLLLMVHYSVARVHQNGLQGVARRLDQSVS